MPVFRDCPHFDSCKDISGMVPQNIAELNTLDCEGCQTYGIYRKGFEDGVKALARKLNRMAAEEGNKNENRN